MQIPHNREHPIQVVFEAIRRNKHVITANKALVAAHLHDIQTLLKEHPGVTFGYEAAVCGGKRFAGDGASCVRFSGIKSCGCVCALSTPTSDFP